MAKSGGVTKDHCFARVCDDEGVWSILRQGIPRAHGSSYERAARKVVVKSRNYVARLGRQLLTSLAVDERAPSHFATPQPSLSRYKSVIKNALE